ncbi:hypothetical protein PENSPDRAFT_649211 [Peniophora sp. CONT]|nr:hypothetical protein PENSPDRAFT_649211 [Peniophora sp. CONT]
MVRTAVFAALLATSAFAATTPIKRATAYFNPADNGGSMLDVAAAPLGEPLNVIVSGLSSADVLTIDGLTNYAKAIGFSNECLGLHSGTPQTADLGDGQGQVDQLLELRQDYHSTGLGTCLESLIGGNHFRAWKQNGTLANSGAMFLAALKEKDVSQHHTIDDDGYDVGRDQLVSNALGTKSHGGVTYHTTAANVTGLLPVGTAGVNHGIAIDGIVTVLTVTIQ